MLELKAMGCSFVPCGKSNGKKPLVPWKDYQKRLPSDSEMNQWTSSFRNSNLGLITGDLSGATVVDSDNPETGIETLQDIFGETPLIISTPRGGHHLYYRHEGEATCAGSSHEGNLKIDVRGQGGLVIIPPSRNPIINKPYQFVEGNFKYIKDLPPIKSGAINSLVPNDRKSADGFRNHNLFLMVKNAALKFPTREGLWEFASQNNQLFGNPLPKTEIEHIVNSVWKLKEANRIYKSGDSFITIESSL